jgi:hypothetical protein
MEARQCKTTAKIREYAQHVSNSTDADSPGLGAWRTWKLDVAHALDPTCERATTLAALEGAETVIHLVPRPDD